MELASLSEVIMANFYKQSNILGIKTKLYFYFASTPQSSYMAALLLPPSIFLAMEFHENFQRHVMDGLKEN